MKIVRHGSYPDDSNFTRQETVYAQRPGALGPVVGGIEMHDLPERMYPAVGASGTMNDYRFIGNFTKAGLKCLLDARSVRLALPPAESAPVVFNT